MEIFFYESRRIRRSFWSLLAIAAVIAALCGFSRVYSDAILQKQAEIEGAYDGLSVDVVISNIQGTKTGQLNIPDYYGALFFSEDPGNEQDASLAPYLKDICMVSHLYYDASSEKEIRGITDLAAAPELAEIQGTVITMLEQEDGLWQSSEKKCLVSYGLLQTLTPEGDGNYQITLSVCASSQGGDSTMETFRVVGYYSGNASRIYIPWRTAAALLKKCSGYYTIDSIRATVWDNRQISSLQDALSRYFSPVDPAAGTGESGRFAATIMDETLNQTIHSLKQNVSILERLWPVVFCVAMLIAFSVSFYAVLTRKRELIAAAGFYIPLAPPLAQKIFSHSFKISYANYTRTAGFCSRKFPAFCSFQPTKSACSAAAEKCLSGVGQPLSSVSGRKRYNTLDFPKENRVPTGMLLAPIGNPAPRSFAPLDTLHIFLENGTQTVKTQFVTISPKIQNRCNFHPARG